MKIPLRENIRIIWAITAKDITDALKNKTTLSVIIPMLFLIVFYRFLPALESGDLLPRLALYDAGSSKLAARLEDSATFDLVVTTSQENMEAYLGNKDIAVLGIVLPEDFDQRAAAAPEIELDGYFVHWISVPAAAETRTFFEAALSEMSGKPVRIDTEGHTVYPQKESRGMAFLQAAMMVIAISLIGFTMTPHLLIEEKQAKTITVMLVSPAGPGQVTIGKALAGLFYCMLATAVVFAFNIPLITHGGVAFLTAVCGAVFTVAVGLLLGSLLESKQQMSLWTWLIFVPLILPVYFSIATDLLPAWFLSAIQWMPTVAMSEAFRVSFSERAPFSAYAPELAIILGYAVILLAVVARVVRREER